MDAPKSKDNAVCDYIVSSAEYHSPRLISRLIVQVVHWQINAAKNEVVIMHALRVLPDYGGRGYSKQLVEHAIQTARSRGWKAIRLDCLKGNDIPVRMYQSYGFKYVDTVDITYVDIGIPMPFHLYELVLG